MSKHQPRYNNESLKELQYIWKICSSLGYAIEPSLEGSHIIDTQSYFTTKPPFVICLNSHTITESFQSISELFEELNASDLEWNYLGNTDSRSAIISYFEAIFWKNHDAIHSHPEYIQILSKPWRVSSFIDYIDHIATPMEMMDQPSLTTLNKLSSVFDGFDLNPYLIINPEGSVQFVITLSHNVIQGFVAKQHDGYCMNAVIIRQATSLESEQNRYLT